jgi:hypothetical protein
LEPSGTPRVEIERAARGAMIPFALVSCALLVGCASTPIRPPFWTTAAEGVELVTVSTPAPYFETDGGFFAEVIHEIGSEKLKGAVKRLEPELRPHADRLAKLVEERGAAVTRSEAPEFGAAASGSAGAARYALEIGIYSWGTVKHYEGIVPMSGNLIVVSLSAVLTDRRTGQELFAYTATQGESVAMTAGASRVERAAGALEVALAEAADYLFRVFTRWPGTATLRDSAAGADT